MLVDAGSQYDVFYTWLLNKYVYSCQRLLFCIISPRQLHTRQQASQKVIEAINTPTRINNVCLLIIYAILHENIQIRPNIIRIKEQYTSTHKT